MGYGWTAFLALGQQNVELIGEPIQIIVALDSNGVGLGRTPAVLLVGREQRTVAKILSFPQHNWKRQGGKQIEQFDHLLGSSNICRVRRKFSSILFDTPPDHVFQSRDVERNLTGSSFAQ